MKVEKCGEYHVKIPGKQISSPVPFQKVIVDSLISFNFNWSPRDEGLGLIWFNGSIDPRDRIKN